MNRREAAAIRWRLRFTALAVQRCRARAWLRHRSITTARLDRIDSRVDAIFTMMRAANEEAGFVDGEPGTAYSAAAAVQARRREMHLVRTEASR